MSRPSKDEYYMILAKVAAIRSTCLSRKVGCVIVKDDSPVSFGFNGPARKMEHCEDAGGCKRRAMPDYQSGKYLEICPASHGEQNAVAFAARHGVSLDGATAYVNTFPCKDCMNSLINAGIQRIVYDAEYDASLSSEIAKKVGIKIEKYEGKNGKELLEEISKVIK